MPYLPVIDEYTLPYWIGGLAAASGVLFVVLMAVLIRYRALSRRYRSWIAGSSGASLDAELKETAERIRSLESALEHFGGRLAALESGFLECVQHVGVVRYRAFEDAGSDLSFSVALLDKHQNGIVLTSLFGRHESRTYAKPILAGKSEYTLSGEEQDAIAIALSAGARRRKAAAGSGISRTPA